MSEFEPPSVAPRVAGASVLLSEVLSALSHALDLTEGQPLGHTERTCLIGMRIGAELGLSAEERSALYYALLLKDAGCSSNASKMALLFAADDRAVKPAMKEVDWHQRLVLAAKTFRNAAGDAGLLQKVRAFLTIAQTEDMTKDLIALRCDRGALIAQRLGFPEATSQAIYSLDEHWCGLGYARGLSGKDIPLLARICNLAQTAEAFHDAHGLNAMLRVVKKRSGTWFDPQLAAIVAGWKQDRAWWQSLAGADLNDRVVAEEPSALTRTVDEEGLDEVARAFADIIDAKSPYTFQHSRRVADVSRQLAVALGADEEEARRIYRAGLLHDIGKLGVSNRILDKDGKLDAQEWVQMKKHPQHSLSILLRVTAFGDFAWTAALHHEKLDGSGYPYGLKDKQLDQAARILAVSDIFDALISDRPYRAGMPIERVMSIISADAESGKLCATVVGALKAVQLQSSGAPLQSS
ncbi:MAG: hypothetical protein JWO05_1919 [Gemmatimonadetes bacterium]|nr:hypothetical protein [Gemmatimonadota bacterium]